MIKFPKKYNSKDLQSWSKIYREKRKVKKSDFSVFTPVFLNVSDKISYNDFFLIYLRDFFNCVENLKNLESFGISQDYQNLFFISNNQFKNKFLEINDINKFLRAKFNVVADKKTISIE